jgi:molybdopterin-synthase adenylyltransferase
MTEPYVEEAHIRYRRQLMLDSWGEDAQRKISNSTFLVAGTGGLGSPVAYYLTAAGVGRLILWDHDIVSLSNLNRQILFSSDDIGQEKSVRAASYLKRLNPSIDIRAVSCSITEETLELHAPKVDMIIDCLDSMTIRFLLNRFAVRHKIPLVHGGAYGLSGQVTLIPPGGKPCLECLFAGIEDQKQVPVLGAAVGIIGSTEALEALKFIAGVGSSLVGRLLIIDGNSSQFQDIAVHANPNCPVCAVRE